MPSSDDLPFKRPLGRPRRQVVEDAAAATSKSTRSRRSAKDDADSDDSPSTSPQKPTMSTEKDPVAWAKACYETVYKEYSARVQTEQWADFMQNKKKQRPQRFKTGDFEPVADHRSLGFGSKNGTAHIFKVTDRKGNNVQKCNILLVPSEEMLPRMTYWVHAECNIKADDVHRLSHIPFVSEDHDDKQFCNELRKVYDEGIHGADRGWNRYINDYVLYKLLDKANETRKDKDSDALYLAIFKLFPNKLSYRQLADAYLELQERYEPAKAAVRMQAARARADNDYHSIDTMFCAKCYQFDCLLHGSELYDHKIRIHRKKETAEAPDEPCSANCYLYLLGYKEDMEFDEATTVPHERSKKKSPSKSNGEIKLEADDEFMNDLRNLYNKGIYNNCELTKMAALCAPSEISCKMADGQSFVLTARQSPISTCQLNNITSFSNAREFAKRRAPIGTLSSDKIVYELTKSFPRLSNGSNDDSSTEHNRKITGKDQHRAFRSFTWSDGSGKVENRQRIFPCDHKGPCSSAQCRCARLNVICDKFCCCGPDCKMKFPGCRCTPGNCRTKQCPCFYAKWECDPEICKTCKCDSLDSSEPMCMNVALQRGYQKRLRVAVSGVAGWGCFIDEQAEKGELVAEYTGEVISKWEAERRGLIYDKFRTSYIFGLNEEQSIDATRIGNLIRFANHSDNNPNCYSQIIVVNGEHRIGVFAARDIAKGEELLFDYQYNKSYKEQFVPIELKKSLKRGPSDDNAAKRKREDNRKSFKKDSSEES